jgi:hypothetical protein
MMDSRLIKVFAKNRAEEYSEDVWGEYVLPPHYDTINLFNYDKAVMIEGGRGSGKTMFLRYHCHDTRFSKRRTNVNKEELKKIGIYFRPDTHFCSGITSDVFGKVWQQVFTKYLLISVLREFSKLAVNLSKCTFSSDLIDQGDILNLTLPSNFGARLKTDITQFSQLADFADLSLAALNDWVNDSDYFEKPVFPDTRSVIESIIDVIKKHSSDFSDTKFTLYIDEYENLTLEQQRLLNTWIKHGSRGLRISAAYKKHGKVSRETTSEERLVLRNDYRTIDLEKIEDDEFRQFAAEILVLKLDGYIDDEVLSKYHELLCSEERLQLRLEEKYSTNILDFARKFFPSVSYEDIANTIFQDKTLRKRLRDFLIEPALKGHKLKPDNFIDDEYPVESILNGILLNRVTQNVDVILQEFKKLQKEGKNEFYRPFRDALVGGILWIYVSAGRRSVPIYSGFDRICLMARSNLRHFLDFCHQCLVEYKRISVENVNTEFSIPVNTQALAARKNSELEVAKVVELGRWGNNLRFIVNRLGLFFQLLQKKKSQSEPEVVHFGIEVASIEQLPNNLKLLLDELKIWSVLIEYQGDTKRKSQLNFTSYEYMLHPMFTPNFLISFRKIRKHMFSVNELETIFCGSENEFIEFCKPYVQKSINGKSADFRSASDIQGSLFDDI